MLREQCFLLSQKKLYIVSGIYVISLTVVRSHTAMEPIYCEINNIYTQGISSLSYKIDGSHMYPMYGSTLQ